MVFGDAKLYYILYPTPFRFRGMREQNYTHIYNIVLCFIKLETQNFHSSSFFFVCHYPHFHYNYRQKTGWVYYEVYKWTISVIKRLTNMIKKSHFPYQPLCLNCLKIYLEPTKLNEMSKNSRYIPLKKKTFFSHAKYSSRDGGL